MLTWARSRGQWPLRCRSLACPPPGNIRSMTDRVIPVLDTRTASVAPPRPRALNVVERDGRVLWEPDGYAQAPPAPAG